MAVGSLGQRVTRVGPGWGGGEREGVESIGEGRWNGGEESSEGGVLSVKEEWP